MECPICKGPLTEGDVIVYEMGSIFLHKPATMKFEPKDINEKCLKADYLEDMDGYHCKKCNKIIAIASVKKGFFED